MKTSCGRICETHSALRVFVWVVLTRTLDTCKSIHIHISKIFLRTIELTHTPLPYNDNMTYIHVQYTHPYIPLSWRTPFQTIYKLEDFTQQAIFVCNKTHQRPRVSQVYSCDLKKLFVYVYVINLSSFGSHLYTHVWHVYVCICMYMYVYTYTYKHVHITYQYLHTHTHYFSFSLSLSLTHARTHTHTYMCT